MFVPINLPCITPSSSLLAVTYVRRIDERCLAFPMPFDPSDYPIVCRWLIRIDPSVYGPGGTNLPVRLTVSVFSLLSYPLPHPHILINLTSKNFTRCGLRYCQVKIYNPALPQRYCRYCKQWYHLSCLEQSSIRMEHSSVISKLHPPPTNKLFGAYLSYPTARGGRHGFVGNGAMMKIIWEVRRDEIARGSLPARWTRILSFLDIWPAGEPLMHYRCITCGGDKWV